MTKRESSALVSTCRLEFKTTAAGSQRMGNEMRSRLHSGETLLGLMAMEFHTLGLPAIVAAAGGDFALYDMEHSSLDHGQLAVFAVACRAAGIDSIVRVPDLDGHAVSRALDAGVTGVMLPMVETVEMAKAFASASRYPPDGDRGAAFGIRHDQFRPVGDQQEAMSDANGNTFVIAQIESVAGVAAADDIANVKGIDALWVGHGDLAISMGNPGSFENSRFKRAIDTVGQACLAHGKAAGYRVSSVEEAHQLKNQGFRLLAYLNDTTLLRDGLRDGLERIRRRS